MSNFKPITVQELIKKLKTFPKDAIIVHDDYIEGNPWYLNPDDIRSYIVEDEENDSLALEDTVCKKGLTMVYL